MRSSVKRLLFLFVLVAMGCRAQTTVTGTITDANGNAYANGTASAQIQTVSGQPTAPSVNTTTDSTGMFTMSLPAGSYVFTVCATPVLLNIPTTNPTPKQVCFSNVTPITVSGASQDVSVALSASAVALGPKPSTGGVGFPSGTGIPQVNSGTSWGSTITVGGGVATALGQTVNTSNGFCTGVGGACVTPAPTTNAVQYVSGTGNDANSGTAADDAHAKLTVCGAAGVAGVTRIVAQTFGSWGSCTIPKGVELDLGPVTASMGSTGLSLSANDYLNCQFGRSMDATPYFAGTIFSFSGLGVGVDAVSALQANGVKIRGCTFEMNGSGRRGIYLSGVSDARIDDNTIVDPGEDGIRVDNGTQQSYDIILSGNHVIHAVGDGYGFRTDAGTADLDRIVLIDDSYTARDVGGATSSGANAFHFLVPSGAATTQSIADVSLIGGFGHLSGTGTNEIYLDYEGADTTNSFIRTFDFIGTEVEGDEGGTNCTGLKIKDAAAANIGNIDSRLNNACATTTNIAYTNVLNYRYTTSDASEPATSNALQVSNTNTTTPAAQPGFGFLTSNGNYWLTPTSDGITRLYRADNTTTQFTLWNPNWTTGGYPAFETNPSATLTAVNYFNINALSAARTTTVPDANTRLLPWDGSANFTPDIPFNFGLHYWDIGEQTAPANPATGYERIFANSGTHMLQCLTSTGGDCNPSGSSGGSLGVDVQGGSTSYTIPAVDNGALIYYTGTGETMSLAQAGSANFTCDTSTPPNCYNVAIANHGTGSITLSTTTSTWSQTQNGAVTTPASVTIPAGVTATVQVASTTAPGVWGAQLSSGTASGSSWLLAHADATSQTANITTTTLYTPPASPTENGYMLQASVSCDSASASATVTVTLKYTDASGTVITNNQAQATCTTLGTASNGSANLPITVQGNTAVTYSTTIANTPTYSVHIGIAGPY